MHDIIEGEQNWTIDIQIGLLNAIAKGEQSKYPISKKKRERELKKGGENKW